MMLFTVTTPDLIFFIVLLAIVLVFLGVYLLTPIVKRKQFAEARANLKKREETFRANLKKLNSEQNQTTEAPVEEVDEIEELKESLKEEIECVKESE